LERPEFWQRQRRRDGLIHCQGVGIVDPFNIPLDKRAAHSRR
jgi:hypothetical protein